MNHKPKIDVIIPARGGSKGLTRKNMQPVGGMPLFQIAVIQALAIFDAWSALNIIVSSEDEEILEAAGQYGVHRPGHLAGDKVGTLPVLQHHMKHSGAEFGCLLQPTHPFREITECMVAAREFVLSNHDSLMQVQPSDAFFWKKGRDTVERINGVDGRRVRRQNMAGTLVETGAFYMFKRDGLLAADDWVFGKIKLQETAFMGIDIHTDADLKQANKLWSREWLI